MFGFGKKLFLGIDVGSSSIKMVEIELKSGKPYLSNYASVKVDDLFKGKDLVSLDQLTPRVLSKVFKEGGFKSRKASMAVPAFGGLITLIEFPPLAQGELEEAIKFEAHKYIPTSLEDVVFSWDIVGRKSSKKLMTRWEGPEKGQPKDRDNEASQDKIQVLLVAASKSSVTKCEKIIADSGLELGGVEIESFSLVRSLIGSDQGNFVIVDMGSRVCNIVLVEKGIIKVNRNIDAGGADITKTIARSMNIDEGRAEKMKISGNNFFEENSKFLFSTLDLIVAEILRVVTTYYGKGSEAKVDSVILSGGTANLTGIDNYFQKSLGIRTVIGNPFGRIGFDKKLAPLVERKRTRFPVAIGLALKSIEEYLKK